jgi:DNA-binding MarR family transcriptional regulator
VTYGPLWEPARDLPQQLTGELFELSSAIDLIGQATADLLGINQTDLICLELLVRRGPMGAGEVAQALGVTTAAVSAIAGRLEAAGYAHREMDPADRRRVHLHASRSGAQQAFSLFNGLQEASTELLTGLRQRDQTMLLETLRRFRQLIADHTAHLKAEGANKRPPR